MCPKSLLPTCIKVGYCGVEETRYMGFSVFGELTGKESFLAMTGLALLSRRLTREETDILDMLSVIVTSADPRIWPIKVSRLAAVFGSQTCGMAAGHLCLMRSVIGPDAIGLAAGLLCDVRRALEDTEEDEAHQTAVAAHFIENYRIVPGFGVPYRPFDQRLLVLDDEVCRRGRQALPYYRTMNALIRAMKVHRSNAPPNVALGAAAVCLDMGFDLRDLDSLGHVLVFNALFANTVEEARTPSASLALLPKECISYKGPLPRLSPRMIERRQNAAAADKETVR
jgi:hypothetical protein